MKLRSVIAATVIAGASPAYAADPLIARNLAAIQNVPCSTLLSSMVLSLTDLVGTLPIPYGSFGTPEATALMGHFKECQIQAGHEANASAILSFAGAVTNLNNAIGDTTHDRLGIRQVDNKRAEAELAQQAKAAKAAADKAKAAADREKVAAAKQEREQKEAEAANITAEIKKLDPSNDLDASYNAISDLRVRISTLPPDIASKLLDELQVALIPIERRRAAIIADVQHSLIEVQNRTDNAEKLHLLGDLADRLKSVPGGSDVDTLAGMIDATRTGTRAHIGEAASTPNDSTLAERNELKERADKERERQQAVKDSADAFRVEQEKLAAKNSEAARNLGAMMGIFSIAQLCAQNGLVYDDAKVEVLKKRTKQFIEDHKIPKDQSDQIWKSVQHTMTTAPANQSDCAELGETIDAVFGSDIFEGSIERNPF